MDNPERDNCKIGHKQQYEEKQSKQTNPQKTN